MAEITKENIIEAIEKMTVLELNELVKALEEKFGVSAQMPVMAAIGAAAGAPAQEKAEEKTEFDVILKSYGDNKIQVLKVVRQITGLGLKEVKDLIQNLPKPIKEKIPKEEAEKIKKQIEDLGGTVEIK